MSNNIKLEVENKLDVGRMVDLLSSTYIKLIESKLSFKSFPSVMLWGQPGVGKSQGVYQIAERIKAKTKKEVNVVDVRLLLFNPIDLRGIPVANNEKTLAKWLKPEIFNLDPSESVVNIIFLDEISAAPQSVQAAAYQLVLDRKIGEHKLPDNCLILAAGNRLVDKSVAYKMPRALANRFMHLDITTNFTAWSTWAISSGINPDIVGFLSTRVDLLNTYNVSDDSKIFATPRSWEMVSNILSINKDLKEIRPLISGLVGEGITSALFAYIKDSKNKIDIMKIFDGQNVEVPKNIYELYQAVFSMVQYAKKEQISNQKFANSLYFLKKCPKEFHVFYIKNCLNDEELKERLIEASTDAFIRNFLDDVYNSLGVIEGGMFK